MKVYIINFAVLVFIGLIAEHYGNKKKIVGALYCSYVWLQLTLIAALRWGNGVDYNQYYNTFYEISRAKGWEEILGRREEIGFLLFNRGMSCITTNVIVYLFAYYGVMYAIMMRYIYKHADVKWVAVAVFIAFDYFAMSLCFMRQSMAMAIGLYALEMIRRRKWYWAIPLTLLASTFHASALLLLACLLFSYIDFTKRAVQIGAAAVSIAIYFSCDFILNLILVGPFEKYKDYLDSQFMAGNHVLVVFYPIFVFALVVVFMKKMINADKDFTNILPVLFLGMVLSVMSTKHYIIERMALYITFYNIRVVPQLIAQFKSSKESWDYQLSIYCALLISIGAFAFGIMNDRYWIRPYRLNENYLYRVNYFRNIEFHLEKGQEGSAGQQ